MIKHSKLWTDLIHRNQVIWFGLTWLAFLQARLWLGSLAFGLLGNNLARYYREIMTRLGFGLAHWLISINQKSSEKAWLRLGR